MMHDIPSGMQEPSDADKIIGTQPSVSNVGQQCRKDEFPFTETSIQVGGACTGDHDGHKVSSVRLPNQRTGENEQNAYEDGTQNLSRAKVYHMRSGARGRGSLEDLPKLSICLTEAETRCRKMANRWLSLSVTQLN